MTHAQRTNRLPARKGGWAERGLGLVELLVALAISLVIVLAATSVYLATRESQRSIDGANAAHEAGLYALRLIGRDLANAGFYPTVRVETPANLNTLQGYLNITGLGAYATGIFGCEGAVFDVSAGTCPTATAGEPDSLVIGYFTNDAFGSGIVGQRTDCEGNDASGSPFNAGRFVAGVIDTPPTLPLFIGNHYTLVGGAAERAGVTEPVTVEGRTVQTLSLGCNGTGSGGTDWRSLVQGLADFQLRYGVFTTATRTPARFHTATEVNALGNLTIGGVNFTPWERVSAVRVCVIARTFEAPAALRSAAAAPRQFENCEGGLTTQAANDLSLHKTYIQVFGLRNRQTTTF